MLWDSKGVQPVRLFAEQRGLAIVLTICDDLLSSLRRSLELACFDIIAQSDEARFITEVSIQKPDIVFLDDRLVRNPTDLTARLDQARTTETLPILSIRSDACDDACSESLSTSSNEIEIFLKTRALLRRERPTALRGQRQRGAFLLDEPRFKLFLAEKSADLSKAELCLLGPFFDVLDEVLDRRTIEHLALENSDRKVSNRVVDFQISRMRRRVKAQLDIDPLRSVRGVGYALSSV